MVQKAAFFISIWYAPWLFKCALTVKAPLNDLQAFQQVYCICESYPTLGNSPVLRILLQFFAIRIPDPDPT